MKPETKKITLDEHGNEALNIFADHCERHADLPEETRQEIDSIVEDSKEWLEERNTSKRTKNKIVPPSNGQVSKILILVFAPLFLFGCADFMQGVKDGFDDPILNQRRVELEMNVRELNEKIRTAREDKDADGVMEALLEMNEVQQSIRELYREAQKKSESSGGTAGVLFSQFLMAILGYFSARHGRKFIGNKILNLSGSV